jgi:hypothetical protein
MAPRRKTRRGRKQKRKTQRGRGRIALAPSVAVYHPPLLCKENENSPYRSNSYVGKLTAKNLTETTKKVIAEIANVDPDRVYTLPPILSCQIASEQTNTNVNTIFKHQKFQYQQIQPYGGMSLYDRLEAKEPLADVLLPLEPFLKHLTQFNTKLLHNDLHTRNLVWDGSVYKMIDFDTLETREHFKETAREELKSYYERERKEIEETSEEFQKELEKQVSMYMKYHDMEFLTISLAADLEMFYNDNKIALGFVHVTRNLEGVPDVIPPWGHHDFTELYTWLFDSLRTEA